MRDVLPDLLRRWWAGEPVALATVVGAWSSAPRPPGTAMLVGPDGSAVGSVSGGCVEADVYATGEQVLADSRAVLASYGISDDEAFGVGLTCGGTLEVFVERVDATSWPDLDLVAAEVEADRPVAVATVLRHPDPAVVGRHLVLRPGSAPTVGTLGSPERNAAIAAHAREALADGRSRRLVLAPDGSPGAGLEVFVASHLPRPRLLVFGSTDVAAALARVGRLLGHRVTVCDVRPVFTTAARFPDADEVVVAWPDAYLRAQAEAGLVDERTVVCVVGHDPRVEVPLLEVALRLPLAYVGAMGSRRSGELREAALRAAGVTAAELRRLHAPIGLDLGARSAEETAVSVLAEVIAAREGRTGRPLSTLSGPVHAPVATPGPASPAAAAPTGPPAPARR